MSDYKIYKGDIIFTKESGRFTVLESGYIVVNKGKVHGTYSCLPEEFKEISVEDFGERMIIPGFVDIHLHAGQFENVGIGLDKELLPWLETYTFPEEGKYQDTVYAKKVYSRLIRELWRQGSTRSVVFATLHLASTEILMELFDEAGLGAFVGKVNMDRNSPDFLIETTEDSLKNTEYILKNYSEKYSLVKPIVTPRFTPTCSEELMKGLGNLAKKYNAPVQSHLSENQGEIEWVKALHPEHPNYATTYNACGLLKDQPTIMAHCVYNTDEEIELMKHENFYVAHCPTSNIDLSSGIAPIRKYMNAGINVGIGTDISGGHTLSMRECIVSAIESSKLYNIYVDKNQPMLSTSEAFYMATKGGGSFFGKVGSFEEGYDFDAIIIDDQYTKGTSEKSVEERLQKFIYFGETQNIDKMFVAGNLVLEPKVCL